jgi:hypothetical protein
VYYLDEVGGKPEYVLFGRMYVEMLAKRREEPIMGKSVEKVAKSGEKWGGMWITFHWHAPDQAPNQRR